MHSRTALLAALALAAFASLPAEAGAKKYFLTVDSFPVNEVLGACGKGYHMATLWEIFDPTQLTYDAKRGQTAEDSGSGPAAGIYGWIRTGGPAATISSAGGGNCMAWTSTVGTDNGTAVQLGSHWDDPAEFSSPWAAAPTSCGSTFPVWCKQN